MQQIKNALFLCFLFFMIANCRKYSDIAPPGSDYLTQVAVKGENAISYYRIPTIIRTPDNGILAFMETRESGLDDFGNIKILAKKSMNNGKTWSAPTIIAENGNLQADNASPVVDYTDPLYPNGRIFLFYCTGNNTAVNILKLNGVREVFYKTSIDNGKTWSQPVNITLQVHHPYQPDFNAAYNDPLKWTLYATGPGHALQLSTGLKNRIVVATYHSTFPNNACYSSVIYTDDHGKSFHTAPDISLQADESSVAELSNGGLILNSRNDFLGSKNHRIISYNFSEKYDSTKWESAIASELPEPGCEGSLINYVTPSGKKVLLFSNPADSIARKRLGIRQSFDDGKTWSLPYVIDPGFSAYSDIVTFENGKIGIIYEADYYNKINFVLFDYNLIPTP
jgi:sialidase-1